MKEDLREGCALRTASRDREKVRLLLGDGGLISGFVEVDFIMPCQECQIAWDDVN